MKKITALLALILGPFLLSAQSVLITPGAQSLNGDSTTQNQLNAFGNGLLVGPKVKFTDEDPASNVHIMDCATTNSSNALAGTLKDPNGDSDYLSGIAHDCNFYFNYYDPHFLAFQIDFEVLDTEAMEDTVLLLSGGEIFASYSGNTLPPSLRVSNNSVTVSFKTNANGIVGAGFVLKWKAILREETPIPIQNYTGEGLVYEESSNSLWVGRHNPLDFQNKGDYSTAIGAYSNASDEYTIAIGYNNTASGENSTAIGRDSEASGQNSTAIGSGNLASNTYSTAIGTFTIANGSASTALGYKTEAVASYATAMGDNTTASGYASTVMGRNTEADGSHSTAMGYDSHAYGQSSIAIGEESYAFSNYSIAMGRNNITSDSSAIAMGGFTHAFGKYSTSMGKSTTASGNYSTAMGENTTADGINSTAIGKDVIANGNGTIIIGDSNPGGLVYTSGTSDKFIARFYNGYYFLTSATGATSTGVSIGHGQTAWSSISDSTKKENFIPADGNAFLEKLKGLKLGSWNYKTEDENPERFYGPMAQEIFAAYGKDAKGTIGSDTLVSTLNMDGLLFIFAQELEKRTASLKEENNALKSEIDALKEKYDQSVVANKYLKDDFEQRISQIEILLTVKSEADLAKQP